MWGFKPLFIASLGSAAAAFIIPPTVMSLTARGFLFTLYPSSLYWSLIVPPLGWLITFGIGLYDFRLKGLWLLAGAPFALFWFAYWVFFLWGCMVNSDCL